MAEVSIAEAPAADEPGLPIPRTWVVMVGALIGALIGVAAVLVWEPGWPPVTQELARSGPFLIWTALIALETMLWMLALPPLCATFLRHWRCKAPDWRREVLPSAGVLVLLISALVVVPHFTLQAPDFMPQQYWRIALLTSGAGAVGLVAAMSIWLIRGRADALGAERSLTDAALRTYLGLRSDLQSLLGFLGAMIGLAVLASAALGRVVQEFFDLNHDPGETPETYPPERVILYGLVLSLFVALVYLPTWATMQRTGSLLRDEVAPPPEPTSKELEAQLKRRAALDDLLGLRVSASVTFKAGVAILTPLLASLTTLLPKFGG